MKQLSAIPIDIKLGPLVLPAFLLLGACSSPEFDSEDWCERLRDTPKVEWTAEEVKGFTNYCIGRNPE